MCLDFRLEVGRLEVGGVDGALGSTPFDDADPAAAGGAEVEEDDDDEAGE